MTAQATVAKPGTKKTVGYRKQATVPLARWCRNRCTYCHFSSRDNDFLTRGEVSEQLKDAKRRGVYNVMFMSGECPDQNGIIKDLLKSEGYKSFPDYLVDLCRLAVRQGMAPVLCVGYLKKPELRKLKGLVTRLEISLENTSERLSKSGLPHNQSPGKLPKVRLGLLKAAGELKIPVATGLLVGIGETRRERYRTLQDIKALHDKYGHVQVIFVRSYADREKGNGGGEASLPLIADTVRYARALMPEMAIQVAINQMRAHALELVELGVDDFGSRPPGADVLTPGREWPNMNQLAQEMKRKDVRLIEKPVVRQPYLNNKWYSPELLRLLKRRASLKMVSPSLNG